jgi:hypothetical protein
MKKATRNAAPEIGGVVMRPPPPRRPAPTPSAKFRRGQRELRGLIEQGHPHWDGTREGLYPWRESCRRRREVEESLRTEFAAAFGFTKDEYQRTKRFYWWLTDDREWPLFDHVHYYQRGSNLVVVSQSYRAPEEELRDWSEKHSAVAWGIVDEWAHYYPGNATCLYVEFERWTPKRLRTWRKLQQNGGAQ